MRKDFPQPFDYNEFIASNYGRDAVNIAYRFTDIEPKCDYALLSSIWHVRNDFGRKNDPIFSPQELLATSKKVGFSVEPLAQVIYDSWKGYCSWKKSEPPVVITPPPPAPPPVEPEKPKLPEVRVPQEKKNPSPTLVKAGVWFGIISTVVGGVAIFVPQIKPFVMIIIPIVKAILTALGAG